MSEELSSTEIAIYFTKDGNMDGGETCSLRESIDILNDWVNGISPFLDAVGEFSSMPPTKGSWIVFDCEDETASVHLPDGTTLASLYRVARLFGNVYGA